MSKYLYLAFLLFTQFLAPGCKHPKTKEAAAAINKPVSAEKRDSVSLNATLPVKGDDLSGFVPNGFVIFDTVYGDLNSDGLEDCILIIKDTDKKNIFHDEYRGALDRNRRGIIALLKEKDSYQPLLKNLACFSSENEDGGNYYAPELYIEIEKGKLFVHYAHGRYGHWKYTFRYQDRDFNLIGYDLSSNRGPVILREVSINYLTGKKIVRDNTNENGESGEEIFKETVKAVEQNSPIKLSVIKDFDDLATSHD